MIQVEYLDRPPPGFFAFDVVRKEARGWDWVALMIDVHPDDLGRCTAHCWVHVPGKYRSKTAAWAAVEDMIATRH